MGRESTGFLETTNGFVYDQETGVYEFPKSTPESLIVWNLARELLSSASRFALVSAPPTELGESIVSASPTSFRIDSNVTRGAVVQGVLTTVYHFPDRREPKVVVQFTPSPEFDLRRYQIAWTVWTTDQHLRHRSDPTINYSAFDPPIEIGRSLSAVNVGNGHDSRDWTRWIHLNWSDEGVASVHAGRVRNGNGLPTPAVIVKFAPNDSNIDPTLIGGSASASSTKWSTQRKVFYAGGWYWAFYFDGDALVYMRSPDGIMQGSWIASGVLPGLSGTVLDPVGMFDVYNAGNSVLVAWANIPPIDNSDSVHFVQGAVQGGAIHWGTPGYIDVLTDDQADPAVITGPISASIGPGGVVWVAVPVRWWDVNMGAWTSSVVQVYNDGTWDDSFPGRHAQLFPLTRDRLILVTAVPPAPGVAGDSRLEAWRYSGSWSSLSAPVPGLSPEPLFISGVVDGQDAVHMVYRLLGGDLGYVRISVDLVGVPVSIPFTYDAWWPSVSADLSGGLHLFFTENADPASLYYSRKASPVWSYWEPPEVAFSGLPLRATGVSAPARQLTSASVVWTETTDPEATISSVWFGSLPLPAVVGAASGFAWQRDGLMPFAQYLAGFDHFVNPGTGQVVVRQVDFNLPGRASLGLALTRLWKPPRFFMSGQPYLYAPSPYFELGEGWTFDIPWMGRDVLHLGDGQEYLYAFEGSEWVNKFGVPFRMLASSESGHEVWDLWLSSGLRYRFEDEDDAQFWGPPYHLSFVEDTHGNRIEFYYNEAPGRPGTISLQSVYEVGSPGHSIWLDYSGGRVMTVTYGGSTIASYGYDPAGNLAQVDYPLGLTTGYSYTDRDRDGTYLLTRPYLLDQVHLASGAVFDYDYAVDLVSTEARSFYSVGQAIYDRFGEVVRQTDTYYHVVDGRAVYADLNRICAGSLVGRTRYAFAALAGQTTQVIQFDEADNELGRTRMWYGADGVVRKVENFEMGSADPSFSAEVEYDDWGNVVHQRDSTGREIASSFVNTIHQNSFWLPPVLRRTMSGQAHYEDFRDREEGLLDWDLTGDAGLDYTAYFATPPSLRLSGSGGSVAASSRSVDSPGNPLYEMALQFMVSEGTVDAAQIQFWFMSGSAMLASVSIEGASLRVYDSALPPPGYRMVTNDITPYRWYTLTLRVSHGLGIYDVFLDGDPSRAALGVPMPPAIGHVDEFEAVVACCVPQGRTVWLQRLQISREIGVVLRDIPSGYRVTVVDQFGTVRWDRPYGGPPYDIIDPGLGIPPPMTLVLTDREGEREFQSQLFLFGGDHFTYEARLPGGNVGPVRLAGISRESSGYGDSSLIRGSFADDLSDLDPAWLNRPFFPDPCYAFDCRPWVFLEASPPGPVSGMNYHQNPRRSGPHRHYFVADSAWPIDPSDYFIQYVYPTSASEFVGFRAHWTDSYPPPSWIGAVWGPASPPADPETDWEAKGIRLPEPGRWNMLVTPCRGTVPFLNCPIDGPDGFSYDLGGGGALWDLTARADPAIAGVRLREVPTGYTAVFLDESRTPIATATQSGVPDDLVMLDLGAGGISLFPTQGYIQLRTEAGAVVYESHLLQPVWGGDIYALQATDFDYSPVGVNIHNRPAGSMTWQDGVLSSPQLKSFNRFDVAGFPREGKVGHDGGWIRTFSTPDGMGRPDFFVDEAGQETDLVYDACGGESLGRVVVNPNGNGGPPVEAHYNWDCTWRRISAETTPKNTNAANPALDNPTSYFYDALGRLTRLVHPDTNGDGVREDVEVIYDDIQDSLTVKDENERTLQRTWFDGLGRTHQVDRLLDGVVFASSTVEYWCDTDSVTSLVDFDDLTYRTEYDARGRPTRHVNPDGFTYGTVDYFDIENRVRVTGEEGDVFDRLYDDAGRLVQVREFPRGPQGTPATASYSYDLTGNLEFAVDSRGQRTDYEYDDLNRQTRTLYPDVDSAFQRYEEVVAYRTDGRLESFETRDHKVIGYDYDYLGRLWHAVVPATSSIPGSTITHSYDLNGNLEAVSSDQASVVRSYDARDRLHTETMTTEGRSFPFTFSYDGASNVERIGYPEGFEVQYDYDGLYRTREASWSLGGLSDAVTLDYDKADRLRTSTRQTASSSLSARYLYDTDGRASDQRVQAVESSTTILRTTHAIRPQAPNGNPEWCQFPDDSPYQNYDKVDEPVRDDEDYVYATQTHMANSESGNARDTYRMTDLPPLVEGEAIEKVTLKMWARSTTPQSGGTAPGLGFFAWIWSSASQDFGMDSYPLVPFPTGLAYSLYTISFPTNPRTGDPWTEEEVNKLAFGPELHWIQEGSVRVSQVWAEADTSWLQEGTPVATDLLHLAYGYREDSRVSAIQDVMRSTTESYAYDGAGRLTQVSNRWDLGFAYDDAGNRAAAREGTAWTEYKYDFETDPTTSYSRLLSYGPPGNPDTFLAYDADGNVRRREEPGGPLWDFDYDPLGQLRTTWRDGVRSADHLYDPLGRRVVTSRPSVEHTQTAFLGSEPAYEREDLANPDRERFHVYAGGMRLAVVERSGTDLGTRYTFADPLGSTRLDAAACGGTYCAAYEAAWKPFGVEVPLSGQGEEKYLGKEAPADDGLYWFGARQYDPATGRFQGLDPIHGVAAHPQTLNRYAYATNDPVGNADPNGMCEVVCALAIIAVAAVATAAVAHYGPAKFRLGMDLAATAIGFIPLFGDVFSTAYFLTHDFLDCAEGHCDGVAIGLDAIGIVPGVPNAGGGAHVLGAFPSPGSLGHAAGHGVGAGAMGVGVFPLYTRVTGGAAQAGFRAFDAGNFRHNLKVLTGLNPGEGLQAHHVFPQKFGAALSKAGINIHDPHFGSWVKAGDHAGWSARYNMEWANFLRPGGRSADDILDYGRGMARRYGFGLNY